MHSIDTRHQVESASTQVSVHRGWLASMQDAYFRVRHRGLLPDHQIEHLCIKHGMLDPFVPYQVSQNKNLEPVVSYGLSSFGYDVRLSNKFLIFNPRRGGLVDPLKFDRKALLDPEEGDYCDIAPGSYILGYTYEKFKIPNNLAALFISKSTYARCGLLVNCTPAEPSWEGHLTLELANLTPCPIRVYAHQGIAQAMFFRGSRPRVNYANRPGGPGKYQGQSAEPVPARIHINGGQS